MDTSNADDSCATSCDSGPYQEDFARMNPTRGCIGEFFERTTVAQLNTASLIGHTLLSTRCESQKMEPNTEQQP